MKRLMWILLILGIGYFIAADQAGLDGTIAGLIDWLTNVLGDLFDKIAG
ncbi:MAG: hypothetical protein V9F00_18495 [Nocardioides sp.]|jgi:hypothetical protein